MVIFNCCGRHELNIRLNEQHQATTDHGASSFARPSRCNSCYGQGKLVESIGALLQPRVFRFEHRMFIFFLFNILIQHNAQCAAAAAHLM